MSPFNVPGELSNDQRSRKINNRLVLVLMLSAFLILFGSIPLSSLSYRGKSTHSTLTEAYLALHSIKSVSKHTPTPIPTQVRVHAPMLNYPLFNGNTRIREIALTFDDGPNPYYTSQVLAILQQFGVKATFFDVGYLVADYPNIVRQEYHQGNIVGNHSWSHPELTNFSAQGIKSQLTSTTNIIQATIGVRPTFFRPPYGAINNTVLAQARNLHYTTVMWDGSAEDW
jgi:peptidoglycan/xylan/chitin deacetylase (PgdA/CDA1 family)